MFESLWNLIAGVFESVFGLLGTILTFFGDVLSWLHFEAPRLEGLLIGVLLAWLLARRDSHPLIRVLSAPLKLVIDILDLAWDQVEEVALDLWGTAKAWTFGSIGWVSDKLGNAYDSVMGKLRLTKENLKQKEEEK